MGILFGNKNDEILIPAIIRINLENINELLMKTTICPQRERVSGCLKLRLLVRNGKGLLKVMKFLFEVISSFSC